MPDEEKKPGESIGQHRFVDQVRPDPSAPPSAVLRLEGLTGNSDRPGWVRLYLSRSLNYYAEFRRDDVVFTETIPADQSPIAGLEATRVSLRQDAVIEYTRTTRAQPRDEFDLDIQLAAAAPAGQPQALTFTCLNGCVRRTEECTDITCDTCRTRCGQPTCHTCQTCQTACGTCQTCQTCQTNCNQATCQTCQTACGTCQTCQTACGTCQTCVTCQTCRTQCNQPTCQDTCRTCVCTDTCHRPCF
jgi:hypothetical protein